MNFKNAWLALRGKLEPVIKEVTVEKPIIGDPVLTTIYRANASGYVYAKWNGYNYLTCEQAHAECPNASVVAVRAIKVGNHYFSAYELTHIQPKPKRAKGKAIG